MPKLSRRPAVWPAVSYAKEKRQVLIWMTVLFAVSGAISGAVQDEQLIPLIGMATGLLFALLIIAWCGHDRGELEIDAWPLFGPMMVICPGPIVLVPAYLFATRGFLHGLIGLLKAAMFMLLLITVSVLSTMAVAFIFQ